MPDKGEGGPEVRMSPAQLTVTPPVLAYLAHSLGQSFGARLPASLKRERARYEDWSDIVIDRPVRRQ